MPYNLGLLLGALFIIFKLLGFVSQWIRGGGGGGSLVLVRSAQSNQLESKTCHVCIQDILSWNRHVAFCKGYAARIGTLPLF